MLCLKITRRARVRYMLSRYVMLRADAVVMVRYKSSVSRTAACERALTLRAISSRCHYERAYSALDHKEAFYDAAATRSAIFACYGQSEARFAPRRYFFFYVTTPLPLRRFLHAVTRPPTVIHRGSLSPLIRRVRFRVRVITAVITTTPSFTFTLMLPRNDDAITRCRYASAHA